MSIPGNTEYIHHGLFENRAILAGGKFKNEELEKFLTTEGDASKGASFRVYERWNLVAAVRSLWGATFLAKIAGEKVYVNSESYAAYQTREHDLNEAIKQKSDKQDSQVLDKFRALGPIYEAQKNKGLDAEIIKELVKVIKAEVKGKTNEVDFSKLDEKLEETLSKHESKIKKEEEFPYTTTDQEGDRRVDAGVRPKYPPPLEGAKDRNAERKARAEFGPPPSGEEGIEIDAEESGETSYLSKREYKPTGKTEQEELYDLEESMQTEKEKSAFDFINAELEHELPPAPLGAEEEIASWGRSEITSEEKQQRLQSKQEQLNQLDERLNALNEEINTLEKEVEEIIKHGKDTEKMNEKVGLANQAGGLRTKINEKQQQKRAVEDKIHAVEIEIGQLGGEMR